MINYKVKNGKRVGLYSHEIHENVATRHSNCLKMTGVKFVVSQFVDSRILGELAKGKNELKQTS
jgi:hypothetical protein